MPAEKISRKNQIGRQHILPSGVIGSVELVYAQFQRIIAMKKLIAALIALTFAAGTAFAQTPATPAEPATPAAPAAKVEKKATKHAKHKKAKHKHAKAKKAAAQ
jgi:hypothetical protein